MMGLMTKTYIEWSQASGHWSKTKRLKPPPGLFCLKILIWHTQKKTQDLESALSVQFTREAVQLLLAWNLQQTKSQNIFF